MFYGAACWGTCWDLRSVLRVFLLRDRFSVHCPQRTDALDAGVASEQPFCGLISREVWIASVRAWRAGRQGSRSRFATHCRENTSLVWACNGRAVRAEIGGRLGCSRCGASWLTFAGRFVGCRPLAKDGLRLAAAVCVVLLSGVHSATVDSGALFGMVCRIFTVMRSFCGGSVAYFRASHAQAVAAGGTAQRAPAASAAC